MFTLRFMNGGDSSVVSAARYDVRHFLTDDKVQAKEAIVTIYPQATSDTSGVEFHVGSSHRYAFPVCFVENATGKTIDRIGPFEVAAPSL